MATQQVAWTVDGFNNLAVLYPNYQSAPFTKGWNIIDLTISASDTVMVLTQEDNVTTLHYTKETFPLEWSSVTLDLSKVAITPEGSAEAEVTEALRIDASPDNTLYLVLNSGLLAQVSLPKSGKGSVAATLVQGVESVTQVSAAPDGLVWVVCGNSQIGSVVQWMDPKNGKWNIVPELYNAQQVTGGPKGKAFIIDSSCQLANYTKKGAKTEIPCDISPRALSIGPDGRLWVVASNSGENQTGGSAAFWTDDDGKSWTEVKGSNVTTLDAGLLQSDFS